MSSELERQREHHGWAFRGYTREQQLAIRHYIKTGEKIEHYPEKPVHPSRRRRQNKDQNK